MTNQYSDELATAICEQLVGGRSLRSICTDDGMPDKATVFRWLASHDAFRDQYARAREAQMEAMGEDIIEIADDSGLDVTVDPETSIPRVDGEAIQRAKLRVDTRKWIMSKLAPKKYGDKITQEHTGPNGAALVPTLIYEAPGGAPTAAGGDAE